MFLYNIAFSLEFLVIAFGTFLISWGIHKARCSKKYCGPDDYRTTAPGVTSTSTVGTSSSTTTDTRHCGHSGTGLAKIIGIILIILSLCNLADTVYSTVKYRQSLNRLHQRIDQIEKNRGFGNSNTTNTNTNSNSNSTTPQNSGY